MNSRRAGVRDTAASRVKTARELLRIGLPKLLGVRPVTISPKKVVATLRVKPEHLNRNRRVGGGVLMAFADVLGAVGAVANRPPGYSGGTIESKTNFFGAAVGPVLTATCVPLHIGRTTSVWQTTIRNSDGRVAAIVTQTQISLPKGVEAGDGAQ
jgi:1,4-dihydroxy-2-naphthoyl-CoA hydrolase